MQTKREVATSLHIIKVKRLGARGLIFNEIKYDCKEQQATLLHIVPFCEGPNQKPERFAKQKQSAIFAMQHTSQLVVHHPSLIYNVPLIIAALLRHIRQTKLCDPLSLRPP